MFQKMTIIGNLGRDPEMRFMPDGKAVTSFSVATSNTYTSKSGEKMSDTTWFRVSVFGNAAEACSKFLTKGSKVFVEGRLSADKATGGPKIYDTKDGGKGANFEIVAEVVKFLSSKQGETSPAASSVEDMDVPF